MKTKQTTVGRTLSNDELTQVSGGHNPPTYTVAHTDTRTTGIAPIALTRMDVPPDPYRTAR